MCEKINRTRSRRQTHTFKHKQTNTQARNGCFQNAKMVNKMTDNISHPVEYLQRKSYMKTNGPLLPRPCWIKMSFCRVGGMPLFRGCGTPMGRVKRRINVTEELRPHVSIVGRHVCNVGPMFVTWVQYMNRTYFSPTVEIRKMSRE